MLKIWYKSGILSNHLRDSVKDAVNNEGVARSLTVIQRDYPNIPKMIKKVE